MDNQTKIEVAEIAQSTLDAAQISAHEGRKCRCIGLSAIPATRKGRFPIGGRLRQSAPLLRGNDAPCFKRLAVLGDIAPYQSMVTGEYIGGRAQHRAHPKEHRLIEVGNDTQAILNRRKSISQRG